MNELSLTQKLIFELKKFVSLPLPRRDEDFVATGTNFFRWLKGTVFWEYTIRQHPTRILFGALHGIRIPFEVH